MICFNQVNSTTKGCSPWSPDGALFIHNVVTIVSDCVWSCDVKNGEQAWEWMPLVSVQASCCCQITASVLVPDIFASWLPSYMLCREQKEPLEDMGRGFAFCKWIPFSAVPWCSRLEILHHQLISLALHFNERSKKMQLVVSLYICFVTTFHVFCSPWALPFFNAFTLLKS